MTVEDERDRRCRALGISGGSQALYNIVVESVADPKHLLSRKLTSEILLGFGYTKEGMQQIGYNEKALTRELLQESASVWKIYRENTVPMT